MPQTFLAQESGLISFVINWLIFGNAKSGYDTGGYSNNNALLQSQFFQQSPYIVTCIQSILCSDVRCLSTRYNKFIKRSHGGLYVPGL